MWWETVECIYKLLTSSLPSITAGSIILLYKEQLYIYSTQKAWRCIFLPRRPVFFAFTTNFAGWAVDRMLSWFHENLRSRFSRKYCVHWPVIFAFVVTLLFIYLWILAFAYVLNAMTLKVRVLQQSLGYCVGKRESCSRNHSSCI